MKRIDEKIKEIEKKDRTNRILFYVIIAIIIAFLGYASTAEKTIKTQGETIEKQLADLQESYDAIVKTRDSLLDTRKNLQMSMTESEFWNETMKIYQETGKVSPFFDYITYGADIARKSENIKEALKKISDEGSKGWLYAGKKENDDVMSTDNYVKVIYRSDGTDFNFNSKPKAGDIVQLTINSRNLYGSANAATQSGTTIGSWQIGLPAYVMKVVEQPGNVIVLQLSYFKL